MKNFSKVIGILLLVLFAASCSNGILSNSSFQSQNDNGKCLVNFSITNFGSKARTILPGKIEADEIEYYEISGKSNRGEFFDFKEVDVENGQGQVVLSYSLWELTLKAYDNNTENKKLLLTATTTVDLFYGKGDIKFTLTEDGVTTPGSVTLGGTYGDLDPAIVDYAISGIYDIRTGALIGSEKSEDDKAINAESAGKFSYTATLDPGEYVFKVQLMGNNDTTDRTDDDIPYAVWSDVVKVAPGRETSNTGITIPASILGSLPDAPTDLMAYYVKDSENQNDDTYKVRLKWKDNSINETKFIATITEYSDKDTSTANIFTQEVLSSITTMDVQLKLGKLYEVSIVATNRLGDSLAAERISATSAETGEIAYETVGNRINRFKITYDLNGGTYVYDVDGDENDKTISGSHLVKYYTYNAATPVPLPQNNVDNVTIKNGDNPLQKWLDGNDNSTEVTAYDGFKNLTVIASYDLKYKFNVVLPNYLQYELDVDRLTLKFDGNTVADNIFNASIENGGNKNITLEIAETYEGSDIVYDAFKVILVGANRTSVSPIDLSGNTYTINTINLEAGEYMIVAIAREKETNNWYSCPIYFTLAR